MSTHEEKLKPINQDMDALRWAKEFMSSEFAKNLPPEVDESLMIAWFANAIMCGYDNARWRHQERSAELTAERARVAKLVEALAELRNEVQKIYDIDSSEYLALPKDNPQNCWAAPSRHLQTFAWIMDFVKDALAEYRKGNEGKG